jgi:hypothetical protein
LSLPLSGGLFAMGSWVRRPARNSASSRVTLEEMPGVVPTGLHQHPSGGRCMTISRLPAPWHSNSIRKRNSERSDSIRSKGFAEDHRFKVRPAPERPPHRLHPPEGGRTCLVGTFSARQERTTAKICGQLLAPLMTIAYSSAQDAKDFAVACHCRGPGWQCICTPQPRTPVVVFLSLPARVVQGSLEFGQLPAPVGPLQLHARAPRLPVVWIARACGSTVVGRLAAVACSFDRGGGGKWSRTRSLSFGDTANRRPRLATTATR